MAALPGPPGWEWQEKGLGAWGCADPPSSLPGFDSRAVGEGQEGLSSSSGYKSSHHPGLAHSCST